MSAPAKPKLLFLAHLLPWPLEGGGQIKSYHALQVLASHFEVTLLAFIRSEDERQSAVPLRSLCEGGIQMVLLPHSLWRDLAAVARAAVTGDSLLISRDINAAMRSLVRATLASHKFAAVHVDHLQMMSSVPPGDDPLLSGTRIVLDQHNVEHRILQMLTEIKPAVSPFLKLAARWDMPRLRHFEQRACRRADRVLAVSEDDAAILSALIGKETAAEKLRVTPIGVDTDYFMPRDSLQRVSGPILSVGTMYWPPNIDAVQWFCGDILPLVRQDFPRARFQIVGAKPTESVLALATAWPDSVLVTGTVPDVRPFMAACGIFVVPLRAGSGMRVKILQAMAMGLPIVSTSLGAEGIAVKQGENILLADTAADFAEAIGLVLTYSKLASRLGRAARELALRQYSLDVAGQKLLHVYQEMGVFGIGTVIPEEVIST